MFMVLITPSTLFGRVESRLLNEATNSLERHTNLKKTLEIMCLLGQTSIFEHAVSPMTTPKPQMGFSFSN